MPPCECCLAEWDNGNGWENYSSADDSTKKTIKDNFNIETFFDHCSEKEPRPAELSELYKLMDDNIVWLGADIDNDYPRNWSDISNMYRAAKRYRCGQCGVDLSEHKDLAVTHHVNGVHIWRESIWRRTSITRTFRPIFITEYISSNAADLAKI